MSFVVLRDPIDRSAPPDVVPVSTLVAGNAVVGESVFWAHPLGRLERVVAYVGTPAACRIHAAAMQREREETPDLIGKTQRESKAVPRFDPTPSAATRKSMKAFLVPKAEPSGPPPLPPPKRKAPGTLPHQTTVPVPPPSRLSHPGSATLPSTYPSQDDLWKKAVEDDLEVVRRNSIDNNRKINAILEEQKKQSRALEEINQSLQAIVAVQPKIRKASGYTGPQLLSAEEVEGLWDLADGQGQAFVRRLLDAVSSPSEKNLPTKEWGRGKVDFCREQLRQMGGAVLFTKWSTYLSKYRSCVKKRIRRHGEEEEEEEEEGVDGEEEVDEEEEEDGY